MNGQKHKDPKIHPVNYILIAVSLLIFGGFGLIFITQMELQPGWVWEQLNNANSMEMYILEGDDINEDGFPDILGYTDVQRRDDNDNNLGDTPRYGGIHALNSLNGKVLWEREFNNPVKRLFRIMDIDGDEKEEYFADIATVGPDWIEHPFNEGEYIPDVYPDSYSNRIINGVDGEDFPILTGDSINFTNFFIHDLVSLDNLSDNVPDLVMIECELKPATMNEYYYNISSYYVNGTKFDSYYSDFNWIGKEEIIPALEKFSFNSQDHILYIQRGSISLLNTSSPLFLDPIFNNTSIKETMDYTITEDLNHDGISEIVTLTWEGNVSVISGQDGNLIHNFALPGYSNYYIDTIGSNGEDNEAFILIEAQTYQSSTETYEVHIWVLSITESSDEIIWQQSEESEDEPIKAFILNEDLNGDALNEIILLERIKSGFSTSEVRRFTILSALETKPFAIINNEYGGNDIITVQDIDGDGKKDFSIASYDRILTLSSSDPAGLWRSPRFPLGFPLFIILIALMGIGLFLIALKGKKLSYKRTNLKEHKLTVVVNTIAIALISLTFVFFLAQLNIFNRTLILGDNMTNITIFFLTVIITWYGVLPLTAALYNRFAPNFAIIFIKLRNLFFKISRSYNNDIIVLDMGERKEIGTVLQLKRIILPLMLSIATGFYTYNTLTPILDYPQNFEVFGSTEFFQFMNGYMLLCILPMILAFLVFSFFISGNFLLDDAGIVYFRESKKYRQPGDIEPISVWAQSIIKGIAGLSAIITLIGFLAAVDFSGFFGEEGNLLGFIFGILIIIVFFAGIPFLTAFSYVLLAGEIMEFSMDFNVQKLYSKMKKAGYDTTPRDIKNIYPSGSGLLKEKSENELEDI